MCAPHRILRRQQTSTLSYDHHGNLTTDDQGNSLSYDPWNRVVAVNGTAGELIMAYSYDGMGRRISSSDGTTTTTYLYSGSQVLEEYKGANKSVRNVYSPVYTNAIIQRDKDTDNNGTLDQTLHFTQDANFNVTSVVATNGDILQHQVYTAYGEIDWKNGDWTSTSSDSYAQEKLFQGMQYDAAIGWYVTPNRLYRANIAVWNRNDPMGYVDGMNFEWAFGGNPINRRDWTGLQTDCDTARLIYEMQIQANYAAFMNKYTIIKQNIDGLIASADKLRADYFSQLSAIGGTERDGIQAALARLKDRGAAIDKSMENRLFSIGIGGPSVVIGTDLYFNAVADPADGPVGRGLDDPSALAIMVFTAGVIVKSAAAEHREAAEAFQLSINGALEQAALDSAKAETAFRNSRAGIEKDYANAYKEYDDLRRLYDAANAAAYIQFINACQENKVC